MRSVLLRCYTVNRYAQYFHSPVTEDLAPGYHQVSGTPDCDDGWKPSVQKLYFIDEACQNVQVYMACTLLTLHFSGFKSVPLSFSNFGGSSLYSQGYTLFYENFCSTKPVLLIPNGPL